MRGIVAIDDCAKAAVTRGEQLAGSAVFIGHRPGRLCIATVPNQAPDATAERIETAQLVRLATKAAQHRSIGRTLNTVRAPYGGTDQHIARRQRVGYATVNQSRQVVAASRPSTH